MLYPVLLVCPDAQVSVERVREAVAWTEGEGARWGGVVPDACDIAPQYGEVQIRYLPPEVGVAGLTVINHSYGLAVSGILGVVDDYATGSWVLEHELLHAQGLEHHSMTEHVMHRSVEGGGWRTDGIRDALTRSWALFDSL